MRYLSGTIFFSLSLGLACLSFSRLSEFTGGKGVRSIRGLTDCENVHPFFCEQGTNEFFRECNESGHSVETRLQEAEEKKVV